MTPIECFVCLAPFGVAAHVCPQIGFVYLVAEQKTSIRGQGWPARLEVDLKNLLWARNIRMAI